MTPFLFSSFLNVSTELDALGDDLAFDKDTSYLDDVERGPAAPDVESSESSDKKGNCYLLR